MDLKFKPGLGPGYKSAALRAACAGRRRRRPFPPKSRGGSARARARPETQRGESSAAIVCARAAADAGPRVLRRFAATEEGRAGAWGAEGRGLGRGERGVECW